MQGDRLRRRERWRRAGRLCALACPLNRLTLTFGDTLPPLLADDWRHTGSGDAGAVEKFSNFFTNARIHQIREMQEQVARETGIPAFDFGEIWEGWQSHQQMVHPLLVRVVWTIPRVQR